VNKYLPPRPRRSTTAGDTTTASAAETIGAPASALERLFAWADRALSR
jgi:hypothetical protein